MIEKSLTLSTVSKMNQSVKWNSTIKSITPCWLRLCKTYRILWVLFSSFNGVRSFLFFSFCSAFVQGLLNLNAYICVCVSVCEFKWLYVQFYKILGVHELVGLHSHWSFTKREKEMKRKRKRRRTTNGMNEWVNERDIAQKCTKRTATQQ